MEASSGRANRPAVLPALVLASLITASLVGPLLLPYSPYDVDFAHIAEPPNHLHWLGTDELGRDILSRVLYGARMSLLVAAAVQLAAMSLGVIVGLIAGYSLRNVDATLMGLVDALYAFPALVLVIVMVTVLPPGVASIVTALTFVSWPLPARVVRGQDVSLRNEEFVVAAHALGATGARVLVRHVLPNAIGPLVVLLMQGAAQTVIGEAALSYLGIGVPASYPTWGAMIANGRDHLLSAPHMALIPTAALIITIISLNRLGEALRMRIDPRLKAQLR